MRRWDTTVRTAPLTGFTTAARDWLEPSVAPGLRPPRSGEEVAANVGSVPVPPVPAQSLSAGRVIAQAERSVPINGLAIAWRGIDTYL
ncbi:hypothetical protein ANANG_G00309940 [Anguilla anguilla]|uniref:Uncharacterized protein n=1 Tax=Anguilla anguilla TaxID=7936 RepID=A0A9D3LIB4_ANGAN|nr:hypothetical protein ANANG_G00309940 [Anguilla anguilla]